MNDFGRKAGSGDRDRGRAEELAPGSASRTGRRPAASESSLAALLGNLPGMAYRCRHDDHWTLEFVSRGCEELTGHPAAELLSTGFLSLLHPADRQPADESIRSALRQGHPYELSYRIIGQDGRERRCWDRGRGVRSAEGELLFLEGFVTDASPQALELEELRRVREELERQVEQRTVLLRRSESRLQDRLRTLSCLQAVHEQFELGIGLEETLRACLDHLRRALTAAGGELVCPVLELGELVLESPLRVAPRDGAGLEQPLLVGGERRGSLKLFWVRTLNWNHRYGRQLLGELATTLAVLLQRRELAQRNLESEKLAATARLAGGVVREISDPLSAVLNSLFIIKQALPESHPDYEYLLLMERELGRISGIAGQLISLYSPAPADRATIDLEALIREVIRLVESKARQRQIQIEPHFPGGLPELRLPITQVRAVIHDALGTMLETMHGNQRLSLELERRGDELELRLESTRPNIKAELLSSILDPARPSGDHDPLGAGVGIGLAASLSIMHSLGGRLLTRVEPYRRTTLTLVFPCC